MPGRWSSVTHRKRRQSPSPGWFPRDGEVGEAEVLFSSLAYAHRAELVARIQNGDAATRDAAMDKLLQAVGGVVAANPTLGGAVDMAVPGSLA